MTLWILLLLEVLRGGAALQWALLALDWKAGGGGLAVGRLSGAHVESSESHQMQLLLVKRGSALPLYLRLVTDHLRLFTLYEQVG